MRDEESDEDVPWSRVRVVRVRGRCRLIACRCVPPLKLFSPEWSPDCADLVQSPCGGGFVQGDAVNLSLEVEPEAAMLVTTQANTRVYRHAGGRVSRHRIEAGLAARAVGGVLPDPVVLHADASFRQEQHLRLARDATLVLLDWMQCGRSDSGEVFRYAAYDSEVQIDRDGEPLILDCRGTPVPAGAKPLWSASPVSNRPWPSSVPLPGPAATWGSSSAPSPAPSPTRPCWGSTLGRGVPDRRARAADPSRKLQSKSRTGAMGL